MRRSIIACAALVIGLGIFAFRTSPLNAAGPTTAPSTQPVNKYCAVNKDEKINPKVTYEYQGKTIGFCCEDCIPDFKKDPEKYMKDLK
jgi:YHS domain-containing protein